MVSLPEWRQFQPRLLDDNGNGRILTGFEGFVQVFVHSGLPQSVCGVNVKPTSSKTAFWYFFFLLPFRTAGGERGLYTGTFTNKSVDIGSPLRNSRLSQNTGKKEGLMWG